MKHPSNNWIVCHLGGRERYAIPRALKAKGLLHSLITDLWVPPDSLLARPIFSGKFDSRWHPELKGARVLAPNASSLLFEVSARLRGKRDWDLMIARNKKFQQRAVEFLKTFPDQPQKSGSPGITVFSYSYCALEIFRYARSRGWRTVLGQIDLGPGEDQLEKQILLEHPAWHCSTVHSPPPDYWSDWREECELTDRMIVNSEWARGAMIKEGMDPGKLCVIPLAYEELSDHQATSSENRFSNSLTLTELERVHCFDGVKRGQASDEGRKEECERQNEGGEADPMGSPGTRSSTQGFRPALKVLFLGQIVARKGIYDLIAAARRLKDDPVVINVVGPYRELPPSLPSNIHFHGRVNDLGARAWYEDADIFVLPTHSDGFALTQLEAMSHGLPVITTPCCGEVVRDEWNGILFPPGDVAALVGILRRLATNRELLSLMSGNARSTLGKFSLNVLSENLSDLEMQSPLILS